MRKLWSASNVKIYGGGVKVDREPVAVAAHNPWTDGDTA
jgi:hypothetical protein